MTKKQLEEKEDEFTWMIEQSKGIDMHMKKIHNGLRNNTLEELIHMSDLEITRSSMDKRYRQRYNVMNQYPRLPGSGWSPESSLINVDKNLHNGRIRHNILMRMYDEEREKLPFFKKLFTKRIKSDYYEVTTHKVKL